MLISFKVSFGMLPPFLEHFKVPVQQSGSRFAALQMLRPSTLSD